MVYVPGGYLFALNPNGTLNWRTPELLGIGGGPSIGADGTVYVNSYINTVYAFNPDGSLKWSYLTSDCCGHPDVPSSPAIGSDGTIYVGETLDIGGEPDGVVLALNPDGSLQGRLITVGTPRRYRSAGTARSTSGRRGDWVSSSQGSSR